MKFAGRMNSYIFQGKYDLLGTIEKYIYVVGVDGNSEAYESIRNGGLDATIDSFPYYMGQVSMEYMLRLISGQDVPKVVWTPQALIDSENVDSDAAEVIGWTDVTFE